MPPHHPYARLLLSSGGGDAHRSWLEDVMATREFVSGITRAVEITDTGCPFFNRLSLAIEGQCNR